MLKCLLLFIFSVLSSCSSIHQELDPKVFYQRDLSIKVNGTWTKRMSVIPYKKSYYFKVKSPGQMDLLIMETCHRSTDVEEVGRRHGFNYDPIENIETKPSCATIKFSSFEKSKKGRHAEGYLVVANPYFKLESTVKCNGKKENFKGTSVCHAKESLYQEISFKEDVREIESSCKLNSQNKNNVYRFKMPNRDCRFLFISKNNEKHILYTSGYEEIILRE